MTLWVLCGVLAITSIGGLGVNQLQAASHREAPITALDHAADITDFFAFVSYDNPDRVTLILNVDPLLEPGNGPNYFPFDDDIQYTINIDNNNDAVPDVSFVFRFKTEIRAPNLFQGFAGLGNGVVAPANSPAPIAPGTPIIPPAITSLDETTHPGTSVGTGNLAEISGFPHSLGGN